ncbi:MAG TPA: hypothetical protein VFM98_11185 [Ramlibacter sp.]|nr:hypothetical protein [Ramlibacter sp.]
MLLAAALSARPVPHEVVVQFGDDVSAREAANALASLGATVLWVNRSEGVWAVRMPDPGEAWRLYDRGAERVTDAKSYSST